MAFDLSYDDLKDPDAIGGVDRVQPGDYHALIVAVEEDGEGGRMEIDLQILNGTTPGQGGKIYSLKLKKDFGEWNHRKLAAFAIASRLRTKEQLKRNKAERRSDPIDWSESVGRSICISLENSEDGKWTNLRFDNIWSPDDKRAAAIPLHADTIKREGIELPADRPVEGVLSKSGTAGKPGTAATRTNAGKTPAAGNAGSADDLLNGAF